MQQETLTRLRNAFALAAREWLAGRSTATGTAASALPFSSMSEADWRQAVALWRRHAPELLAGLARRSCPACGSESSRWLFETYDGHPQHECTGCGCWFVPLVVDWAVFDRLFAISPEAAAIRLRGVTPTWRASAATSMSCCPSLRRKARPASAIWTPAAALVTRCGPAWRVA